MRKLTLSLDTLVVQSFDASPSLPAQRGTVRAYVTQAWDITCNGYDTCLPNETCGGCTSDFSVLTDCHRC